MANNVKLGHQYVTHGETDFLLVEGSEHVAILHGSFGRKVIKIEGVIVPYADLRDFVLAREKTNGKD